jgi:hypothetical protein
MSTLQFGSGREVTLYVACTMTSSLPASSLMHCLPLASILKSTALVSEGSRSSSSSSGSASTASGPISGDRRMAAASDGHPLRCRPRNPQTASHLRTAEQSAAARWSRPSQPSSPAAAAHTAVRRVRRRAVRARDHHFMQGQFPMAFGARYRSITIMPIEPSTVDALHRCR